MDRANVVAHEQRLPVESEHLLLGLVELEEGTALKVLKNLGISIPQLRDATLAQLQTLPRQPASQPTRESEVRTSLPPVIPPPGSTAPKWVHITTLPQDNGRWVTQINATSIGLDGPSFRSIGYGDRDNEAIANALESLARMYRDYQA